MQSQKVLPGLSCGPRMNYSQVSIKYNRVERLTLNICCSLPLDCLLQSIIFNIHWSCTFARCGMVLKPENDSWLCTHWVFWGYILCLSQRVWDHNYQFCVCYLTGSPLCFRGILYQRLNVKAVFLMNFKPIRCWEAAWYNICHNTQGYTHIHTHMGDRESRVTGVFFIWGPSSSCIHYPPNPSFYSLLSFQILISSFPLMLCARIYLFLHFLVPWFLIQFYVLFKKQHTHWSITLCLMYDLILVTQVVPTDLTVASLARVDVPCLACLSNRSSQRVSGLPIRYSHQSFLQIFPAVFCFKWGQWSISQWIPACFHSPLPLSWFISILIASTYSNMGVCLDQWVSFREGRSGRQGRPSFCA